MLYILDPNLKDYVGHYLEYDMSVVSAARDLGMGSTILASRDCPASDDAGAVIRPVYSHSIWNTLQGFDFHSAESLDHANAEFAAESGAFLAGCSLTKDDVLFFPNVTKAQIAGIATLAERFGASQARFEIMLRYQAAFYDGPGSQRAFARLRASSKAGRVAISTDSHRLAHELSIETGLAVAVYPIPHCDKVGVAPARADDAPLHFVSLGSARGEKGLGAILDMIEASADAPWASQVRFTIQCNDPSDDIGGRIEQFSQAHDARTTLIDEAMESDAYYALLASADVVMTPYHADIYAARTSGVLLEALTAGKVVICTRNTWMSDVLAVQGGGVLCDDKSPLSLLSAVADVIARFPDLQADAKRSQAHWSAVHTPSNLVSHLTGAPLVPVVVETGRKAAIFYPWGDAIEGGSGAATRLFLLIRYLELHYDEVRVTFPGSGRKQISHRTLVEAFEHYERWDTHWARRWLEGFVVRILSSKKDKAFHLWNHLWPMVDDTLARKANELTRWADDVYLEYSYFAPAVSKAARAAQKPVTLTQYDILSQFSVGLPIIHQLTRFLEFRALRQATRLIVATEKEQDICAQQGISAELIPHPIDAGAFAFLSRDDADFILQQMLGLPMADKTVCFFVGGSYGPNKTAARDVKAMADAALVDPDLANFFFVVAGSCMAPESGENFVSLGRVEETVLAALYRIEPIVLIPLLEGTGSSIKSIEAMANGCLIISTAIGMRGLPVQHGVHAILENDISRYLSHIKALRPDSSAALRAHARELGATYDYRNLFQSYVADRGTAALPDPDSVADLKSRRFRELLPRAAELDRGDVNAFLKDKMGVSAATFEFMMNLDRYASDDASGSSKKTIEEAQLEPLVEGWISAYESGALADIKASMIREFRRLRGRFPAKFDAALIKHLWILFSAPQRDLSALAAEAFFEAFPQVKNGELRYIAGVSLHIVLGANSQSSLHYNEALMTDFVSGWLHFHRGRLLLERGLRSGLEELTKAEQLGGDAAKEAKQLRKAEWVQNLGKRGHGTPIVRDGYDEWRTRFAPTASHVAEQS